MVLHECSICDGVCGIVIVGMGCVLLAPVINAKVKKLGGTMEGALSHA